MVIRSAIPKQSRWFALVFSTYCVDLGLLLCIRVASLPSEANVRVRRLVCFVSTEQPRLTLSHKNTPDPARDCFVFISVLR